MYLYKNRNDTLPHMKFNIQKDFQRMIKSIKNSGAQRGAVQKKQKAADPKGGNTYGKQPLIYTCP